MSVYDDLASILRKAQGIITEDGNEIDVGREVVMLRSAHEEQVARIAELEAENQRLHAGIANAMLCDSVVQMHECLAGLLGGNDNG